MIQNILLIDKDRSSQFSFKTVTRRRKRSAYKKMSKTITRIQRGFQKVVNFHTGNLIKGIQKIFKTGNNIHRSIDKLAADGLKDIDNRLNRQQQEFAEDEEEEDEDVDTNILVDFCFGEIYGKNYGIRTFLEYEEECQEGVTCAPDINVDTDDNESESMSRFLDYEGNIL